MLVSMTVRNIALIEQLHISFHQGMHVLTGETGAGKSIVVDSLNLVLGERADRGLIRAGESKATVEALVDISGCPGVKELLETQMLEAEGNLLSIQREITVSERNICRVCGTIVPLTFLRQITELLVDIHGQHEHQSLLDVKNHMGFLDGFGDEAFVAQQKKVKSLFHAWKDASAHFARLRKENADREYRTQAVTRQLEELDEVNLKIGESEALVQEHKMFAGAEKINNALDIAYSEVLTGEGAQDGAMQKLKNAADAMQDIADISEEYKALADRLLSVYYEAEEMGIELRQAVATFQFDPTRHEKVQERLGDIQRLERKYAMTADAIVRHHEALKNEFHVLDSMEEQLKTAEAEYKAKLISYRQEAGLLTEKRKALALQFQKIMEAQLQDLGMSSTHFECVFHPPSPEGKPVMPTENGDDHIEFYIAPNPGEPLKPLYKTASGGELSRLMLALKSAGASRNMIPCMIFDEIDTGISGHIAGVVAEKMAQIAKYRQVICVTHLAQIACMADVQYLVSKHVTEGRTVTSVDELPYEQRVNEIARLVGSASEHMSSGLQHARNMLDSAQKYKEKN